MATQIKYSFPTRKRAVTRQTMELDYTSNHGWYRPDPDVQEKVDWRPLDIALGFGLVFAVVVLAVCMVVVHYTAPVTQ